MDIKTLQDQYESLMSEYNNETDQNNIRLLRESMLDINDKMSNIKSRSNRSKSYHVSGSGQYAYSIDVSAPMNVNCNCYSPGVSANLIISY